MYPETRQLLKELDNMNSKILYDLKVITIF